MSNLTITRADIVQVLRKEIGLSKVDSHALMASILDHIIEALLVGEVVKLAGFGTFSSHHKRERIGRNPQTGKPATIDERFVIKFKSSQKFTARVTKGCQRVRDQGGQS